MAKKQALTTLIELATEERDNAVAELGRRRQVQQQAQKQLDILLQYQQDYQQKLDQKLANGMSIGALQNYQNFIGALDTAIQQQKEQLKKQERSVEQGKKLWQSKQRQLKSYDILATRRRLAEQRIANRREQLQTDEFAARAHSTHHRR